ncbi:TPX2 [Branchiostoma lanceolatum]|uniref:TPX2 protein n=1 Tax=Branchiostoma lanceolatum TaxID=7740 RepID=A0A8K0A7R9_BRALA|nr:TPX2 [Branchiostoma lanceolatum]
MSQDVAGDSKWDFNCPQFVDFSEPQTLTLDDNADEWFDYQHEIDEDIPLDAPPSPEVEHTKVEAVPVTKGTETLQKMQETALAATAFPVVKATPYVEKEQKKDMPESPAVLKEKAVPEKEEPTVEKVEPPVEVVIMQPEETPMQFTAVTEAPVDAAKKLKAKTEATRVRRSIRRKSFVKTEAEPPKEVPIEPANKKQKTTAKERRSAPTAAAPRVRHTSGKTRRSADTTAEPPVKKAKPSGDHKTRVKLTMPKTPECAKRSYKRPGVVKKTSEQLELERIEQMRQETRRQHQIAEESYKQAQASAGYHAARAAVPLTKPHGFHFHTDERIKDHTMETRQDSNNKRFEESLRTHPPSPVSGSRTQAKCNKVTKPKPFKFTNDSRKRKLHEVDHAAHNKWHSVSEQVINFHKRTPDRFRRKAKMDLNVTRAGPVVGDHKLKLTQPQSPNFSKRARNRSAHVKSAAEIEEEEVEEMKKYKFKAREIDQRLFQQAGVGVPKKPHKPATQPVGMDLETDRRIQERQEEAKSAESEERFEFHARPIPAKILEGPVGVAEKKVAPLTIPESPAFALKNRVRSVKPEVENEEEERIIYARPMPHTGVPFKPNREHKVTQLEPFSFQDRVEEQLVKKEEKIQHIIQEEAKVASSFRAQNLPGTLHEPGHLPDVPKKAATNPEPFQLSCDDKGAKKAAEWSKKMEEELKQQREQASSFKHRPADILYKEPFVPQKATKPLTDVSEFDLNTVRRAEQRQEFEMQKKMKEEEMEALRLQQEEERKEQEQIEIARLRKELVHKANPIRQGRPLEIQPSNKPLTNPQTPNFTDRRRKASVRL